MSLRSRGLLAVIVICGAMFASASPAGAVPNPCDLPGAGHVCDIPRDVVGGAAGAAGDAVMAGVTTWVTHFAVWVTGQVGGLIAQSSSPDVQAAWFVEQYSTMLAIAGALALPMLLLALIQAVMRQDLAMLARSAFGYLPMAFILAAAAVVATQLLIQITDDLSLEVARGLGNGDNLLARVGDAYSQASDSNQNDTVPLFGAFLGALVLAVGSLVLWLELVIRDATIYIALFFLPLTFVAMIWPATSRYARRLVEFLVAVILAKLVIVSIVSLATAALTHSSVMAMDAAGAASSDHMFERMVAGAALLLLAAYSPFALLRAIPLIEGAAASVGQSRQSMAGVAASAGVQSPSSYMRQAMSREPSGYAPAGSAGVVSTTGGLTGALERGAPTAGAATSWMAREGPSPTSSQSDRAGKGPHNLTDPPGTSSPAPGPHSPGATGGTPLVSASPSDSGKQRDRRSPWVVRSEPPEESVS